jgi:phosphoglycolate phosphatase
LPYRLAIFDYDGTLADSFAWFTGVYGEVAQRFRLRPLDRDALEAARASSAGALVRQLEVPAWKLPLIANHMRKLAARDRDAIRLFPGVADMLHALAACDVAIAIVTSNSEENVRHALGAELAGLVRHFACGASLFGKRRKLRSVLRLSGVPARDGLVIGDEIRDLEAARAEGLPFGAVGWGYTTLEALQAQRPEELFATVAQISRCFTRA